MIFDKQLMFSENQDLSQDAGTYKSNTIDLAAGFGTIPQAGPTGSIGDVATGLIRDLARGKPISFFAQMTEALSTGSSPTLRLYVYGCATIDGSNDLAATTITYFDSGVIAAATLVAGYRFRFGRFSPNTLLRYMQCNYVIGTATTTTGTITAGLTFEDMIPNLILS